MRDAGRPARPARCCPAAGAAREAEATARTNSPALRERGPGPADGRADHAQLLGRVQRLVGRACAAAARHRSARARAASLDRRRVRGGLVEHDRHQVGGRDAVDHAVVDLRQQRPAVLAQPLDHPDLPQRLSPVQLVGEDPRGGPAQDVVGPRRRQGTVPQVVGQVEMGVVDPHGAPQPERYEANLLPVARHASSRPRPSPRGARTGGRTLEDAHATDVHRVVRSLDVEERRVHGAHPLHRSSAPGLEDLGQHSVDGPVDRHPGVARLALRRGAHPGPGRPARRRCRRCASRSPRPAWPSAAARARSRR